MPDKPVDYEVCDSIIVVIEPVPRRLPRSQLSYLLTMAKVDQDVARTFQVSGVLGRDGKEIAPYRRRLIDAGIIEPCGYGRISFAVPYMGEYPLAHAEQLEMRFEDE